MIYRGRKLVNKNFIIAGSVLLVVGLAVAIGVSLVDEPLDGNLPVGETAIEGDFLPEFAGENDDNIARGLQAPIFSGPNENSEIVSLEKNGNAKVLLFLAHWCGYCQKEVPAVQEYIDLIGIPDGVEIIAVATSIDRARDNYPPHDWLKEEGWSESQIYDLDREIGTAYGLNAFPYWVFVDKELNVVARRTGNLPQDQVGQLLLALANQ
jgi:cytochrome c biogenesis protein CcmG/thiol:disulfide interchange protein DsbE